ncbi:TPA: hypothetical protein ACX6PQ_002300, partial [Photobacterium damselae]
KGHTNNMYGLCVFCLQACEPSPLITLSMPWEPNVFLDCPDSFGEEVSNIFVLNQIVKYLISKQLLS